LRATYYNYDIDGNVKTLWQQVDGLYVNSTNAGLKRIDYEYDLVSGKVNFVRYQDGQPDALKLIRIKLPIFSLYLEICWNMCT
jgi:hypothetical protein